MNQNGNVTGKGCSNNGWWRRLWLRVKGLGRSQKGRGMMNVEDEKIYRAGGRWLCGV